MDGGVQVRRRDGDVEVRCRLCKEAVRLAASSFTALMDAVNLFLGAHRHSP